MKKITAALLVLYFIISFSGCKTDNNSDRTENTAYSVSKQSEDIYYTGTEPYLRSFEESSETLTGEKYDVQHSTEEFSDMQETESLSLSMKIGDADVSVEWENNESVEMLKDMCRYQPLIIEMSMYGGFEQVGSLGLTLPFNDTRITSEPGDVFLYSGNQIVLFYGSNTWAYTRLGHVADLTEAQIKELLSKDNTVITLFVD